MIERLTLPAHPRDGYETLEPGAGIGVRGYPGTIVSADPTADDPGLVDLVVDVEIPDPEPEPPELSPPVGSAS